MTAQKGRTHDCKRPLLITKKTLASRGPSTHEAALHTLWFHRAVAPLIGGRVWLHLFKSLVDNPDNIGLSEILCFSGARFDGLFVQVDRPFPCAGLDALDYGVALAAIFHTEPIDGNGDSSGNFSH
jgi:hypothetical protein